MLYPIFFYVKISYLPVKKSIINKFCICVYFTPFILWYKIDDIANAIANGIDAYA